MYTIHATRRWGWYATAIFWRPQVALLVNERTLLPVFLPLAPATTLAERFPDQLGRVLEALGTPLEFVLQEIGVMGEASDAKTANRSVVGSMNDFARLAEFHRTDGDVDGLVRLSVSLSETPCSPLDKEHISP